MLDLEEAGTCLPVVQDVLRGFDIQRAHAFARDAMHSLPIVESPLGSEVFDLAVDLYRSARSAGLAVGSAVDCLIAACALRSSLPVLHRDRDFDALAKVSPLKVRRI